MSALVVDSCLSIDDLCRLIKDASTSGVRELSLGQLSVKFKEEFVADIPVETPRISSDAGLADTSEEKVYITPEEKEDMRMSQLLSDDPQAFEQEIIDQHMAGHGV